MRVDLIFSLTDYEREAMSRSHTVRIGDTDVRFAAPEDVIIGKVFAGRPRDLVARCLLCGRRRVQLRKCPHHHRHCRTCCMFIAEYVDTGLIMGRTSPADLPMMADVPPVMMQLGVSQKRGLQLLGH
jgi:hypothetical protein